MTSAPGLRAAPRVSILAGAAALTIGLLALAGWASGIPNLTSVIPGWPPMAPLTALAGALCSIALIIASLNHRTGPDSSPAPRYVILLCAAGGLLIGLTRLAAHLLDWTPPIGDALGLQNLARARGMRMGIMSPATALTFVLVSIALILGYLRRASRAHQIVTLLALTLAGLGLIRYLFGGTPLVPYSQMAVHTAIMLLLLCAGALTLRQDVGLLALLAESGSAGASARRLLPAALLIPPIAGAVALHAQRTGILNIEQSFSLLALSSVFIFVAFIWVNTTRLRRAEIDRHVAQEALRASDERTRLIVDTALDAVITIDHTGVIIGWSPQAATLFGWDAGEVLGRSLAEVAIPERHRAAHTRGMEHYLATGAGPVLNRRVELTALRRDQTEFPIELSITPIRSGSSISFSGFVRDITERKRAETAVRESQELLQSIIDNSSTVVFAKYLDGRYLLVNRQFETIFQRSRNEVLGRTDHELFDKATADIYRSLDRRVTAAGAPLTEEETAPLADGIHTYLSVKAPLRNSQGEIYATVGISTDITERISEQKMHERKLRTQLARLNLLHQITRAIGERQDMESIFRVAIGSLEDQLPIDFGAMALYQPASQSLDVICLGTKSVTVAAGMGLREHARITVDRNGLGRCVQGELVYEPDVSGAAYPFPNQLARGGLRSVVFAPLSFEGKVFGVMVTARREPASFTSTDCEFLSHLCEHLGLAAHQTQLYGSLQQAYEELRQTQQAVMQQERLRVLGQMASGVAHDINNALSPAALYAQSLLERDASLSTRTREYLTLIQRAIDDVGRTVARLREFYRPRDLEVSLTAVALNVLLDQVAELTRARWSDIPQERGIVITLQKELAADLPPIMGAENEIRDAFTNLVLNAVDAMPDGGVLTLRSTVQSLTSTYGDAKVTSQVVVEIIDTGVGMSEAVRSRCFEPFFTTKGERGTGLGLGMVHGMAQRHSARIDLDSTPGMGTTVRLTFPVAAREERGQKSSPARAAASHLRVLLVDDDPLLLECLQAILQTDGHTVVSANGGQAGIDEFFAARSRGASFDIVMTDLGMPNVDGRTVAASIKSATPETPIVLLTGWGQRLQGQNGQMEYVDRVLSKPPDLNELRATLAELARRDPPATAARATSS